MRVFTYLLFVLTVVAGLLSYYGIGTLTETVKLTYAYLALSTVACVLISLTMRPAIQPQVTATTEQEQ
ncbi:MAG: hypothetical protein JO051_12760 [Acidobacteriaceae bacterium]|nr:hypothetical protein [Acidobacteriaceae bacterium]